MSQSGTQPVSDASQVVSQLDSQQIMSQWVN